uniref:Uncharacterized protein n=1 Tax=Rhizophora mucronata TaxID=61149 RepID=A0A2P2NN40_RHIMU
MPSFHIPADTWSITIE